MVDFPAVSHTRIDFWKTPHYKKSHLFWITLLFGFFGFHHLFLRSPQTFIIMLIANFLTFGYTWWYDLITIKTSTVQELNTYGLESALYPFGVAQGMFIEDDQTPSETSPPSPLWFLLYFLTIPIGALSSAIAGDTSNGIARFLNIITGPIGWIVNGIYIFLDYINVIVYPDSFFSEGVKRYFPFTLFMDPNQHSNRITGKEDFQEDPTCQRKGFFSEILVLALPIISIINPGLAKSIEQGMATAKTAVNTATSVAQKGVEASQKVSQIVEAIPQATQPILNATKAISNPQALAQQYAQQNPKELIQTGGALRMGSDKTPLDYLTGGFITALIAGGAAIAYSRSSKNEAFHDSPPHPRTI